MVSFSISFSVCDRELGDTLPAIFQRLDPVRLFWGYILTRLTVLKSSMQ